MDLFSFLSKYLLVVGSYVTVCLTFVVWLKNDINLFCLWIWNSGTPEWGWFVSARRGLSWGCSGGSWGTHFWDGSLTLLASWSQLWLGAQLVLRAGPSQHGSLHGLLQSPQETLTFWETAELFSTAVPFYIPITKFMRIQSTYISHTFFFFNLFYSSHSSGCEVISLCGFDLHFCGEGWCWASL